MLEDKKAVIRISKSKDRKYNGQKKKYKQRSANHYTENVSSSNTNPAKKNTKEVIRIRKSKDRQHNSQQKGDNRRTDNTIANRKGTIEGQTIQ